MIDPFLYPFKVLQHYCFKMYFMLTDNRVSWQVVWPCESLLFFKLSPVQLLSFSDVKKKSFVNNIGHCIMRFILFHKAAVWRRDCGLSLWQGIWKQILFSSCCHSIYSVFLACQKCSTRALAVYVSPICSVFLLILFLPLPQNSKKGLVAWQVWYERSATPNCCLWWSKAAALLACGVPLANTLPRNCKEISINICPGLVWVT